MLTQTGQYEKDIIRFRAFSDNPLGESEKISYGYQWQMMPTYFGEDATEDFYYCFFGKLPAPYSIPTGYVFCIATEWTMRDVDGNPAKWQVVKDLQEIVDAVDIAMMLFAIAVPEYYGE